MFINDTYTLLVLLALTAALAVPMGYVLQALYKDHPTAQQGWTERFFAPLMGRDWGKEQSWSVYLGAVIVMNAFGWAILYCILMFQDKLPLNPQNLPALPCDLAINIASSFVTNTNWQSYAGENTLSQFSQMFGLTVQNFLSAATGLGVAMAVIRGFSRSASGTIGNFYVDVIKATFAVLLPLCVLFSVILIATGVPQNLLPPVEVQTLEGMPQTIPQGPIASQIAIKILGSNGGGYFNANAAHPYENPSPLSNLLQMVMMLALPLAVVLAFGRIIKDSRQSLALLAVMAILFICGFVLCVWAENTINPQLSALSLTPLQFDNPIGVNLEGKETRFGTFTSALWATLTTGTSNGSVNTMHDSFMPLAGLVLAFNLLLGGVIFGGVGCGLYGILVYVLITVFIAGLMVGRTPEYLGKKIEAHEIKLSMLTQLLYPILVLGLGSISLLSEHGGQSISTAGAHGLTQTLYAYASAAANNGSAFAGFNGNTPYQNIMLSIAMLVGRFGVIAAMLAIAGSLAAKKHVPASNGTLPTHGVVFMTLVIAVILLFGGLTYFPALALGPIAEHFTLFSAGGQ